MELKGKKIVIIGGSSGMGLATAQAAARENAQVVIVSHRRDAIATALQSLPTSAEGFAADATNESEIKSLFEKIGAFDHLIYTAGDSLNLNPNILSETPIEESRKLFEVRYWGIILSIKYAHRWIRPGGSVILTNGVVGLRPMKAWSIHASVAGAIESLTRALAIELAPLRVNGITAGIVDSPLWGQMDDTQKLNFFENAGLRLPVGRIGTPEDIAQANVFLMKEEYCTGQMIILDGGSTLV